MKEEDLRRVEREISRAADLEKKRGRVAMALSRGKHLNPGLQESRLELGQKKTRFSCFFEFLV